MRSFLILSFTNRLFPFASRLRKEGHAVQALSWHDRYEKTWEGLGLGPTGHGASRRDPETLASVVELARTGGVTILSDSKSWDALFEGALEMFPTPGPHQIPEPLRLGFWFNGETASGLHLLVGDRGLWPGGLSRKSIEGGLTLVRMDNDTVFMDSLTPVFEQLKMRGHRGLVQAWGKVDQGVEGIEFSPQGWAAGWLGWHPHLVLAALGDEPIGPLLEGGDFVIPKQYAMVVPISIPPWPFDKKARGGRPITVDSDDPNVVNEVMGKVIWHDIKVTHEGEQSHLGSAGVDGLLGVARGSANTLSLARRLALGVAGAVVVDEKQFRPDAGATVENVLDQLDAMGIVW